jgi:carboxylesterase type B
MSFCVYPMQSHPSDSSDSRSKQWTEPFDANSWPNPCYQIESMFEMMNNNFGEECLYLNIWCESIRR